MYTGKRGSYHGCVKTFQNDLVEMQGIYEMDNKNSLVPNQLAA